MNLKQLEAFVHVAEGGSFSKAARELYLTQPTVSAHIASLEKELNVRLFVRNTKEVSLSQGGHALYKYAKQMVELEAKIGEYFDSGNTHENYQCITIAASTVPSQYLLPKVLLKFREKYPKEQLKLIETDSSKVVTQIVEHAADVGFTGTVLEKKHCKYIPFYKDKLVIVTPNTEKYREIQKTSGKDISWMQKEPMLMREEGSGTRKEAEKQLRCAGLEVSQLNVIASIENQETIKRSVRQGMGISVMSGLATQDEAKEGHILVMPIPFADEGRDIQLVYNKNYRLSRSAERFIKVVKEIYEPERIEQ